VNRTTPIRVLLADDSSTARALLSAILGADDRFEVVGQAVDGLESVAQAARLKPDVILMDIHMPGIDGVEATRRIMDEMPTPIVMVTASANHADIKVTLNALNAGALAVLHKPVGPGSATYIAESELILATVIAMAGVMVMRRQPRVQYLWEQSDTVLQRWKGPVSVVAIAASTGGPTALRHILSELTAPFPVPVLVVQHIALGFGQGLAEWLGEATALQVKVAVDHEPLAAGTVYIAPDQLHLGVSADGRVALSDTAPVNGAKPSATHLFSSVADAYGSGALAVILTGMGRDGASGLHKVKAAGGLVLAQDEHSSVVFGMPGAAVADGVVDVILPLDQIAVLIGREVRLA